MEAFLLEARQHCNFGEMVMHLRIYIDSADDVLKTKYLEAVQKHNSSLLTNHYPDSGFDLINPIMELDMFWGLERCKINYNVKCSASMVNISNYKKYPTAFYIYPRSSISKTCFRLANGTGIIDAGYRGSLIGVFDHITGNDTGNFSYERLTQICSPNLTPIFVEIVSSFADLGEITIRNDGGFGSTGC